MSVIPIKRKKFNPGYGGCRCACHIDYGPGGPIVKHCFPCCYPDDNGEGPRSKAIALAKMFRPVDSKEK